MAFVMLRQKSGLVYWVNTERVDYMTQGTTTEIFFAGGNRISVDQPPGPVLQAHKSDESQTPG